MQPSYVILATALCLFWA